LKNRKEKGGDKGKPNMLTITVGHKRSRSTGERKEDFAEAERHAKGSVSKKKWGGCFTKNVQKRGCGGKLKKRGVRQKRGERGGGYPFWKTGAKGKRISKKKKTGRLSLRRWHKLTA